MSDKIEENQTKPSSSGVHLQEPKDPDFIIDTTKMSKEKAAAMEMVEAAREQRWEGGSFVRDVFMGNLRFQNIFPFPEQLEEDEKAGKSFLTDFKKVLKEKIDPDQIDRDGELPQSVIEALAE